ncbi:hypothetical protein F3K24_27720 [Streptomyces sp. LBUM 1485]|nr:hypothetical protein [Streptomyces sp. LBUM 1485]
MDAFAEGGELFAYAGLLELGLLLGADFADLQFGADVVEVAGEAHGVGEGVGVDVLDGGHALELGDGCGFQAGEFGVAGEGQVGRGTEELFRGHVVLRDRRVVCGLNSAL